MVGYFYGLYDVDVEQQRLAEMQRPKPATRMFVHVLLFRCPQCGAPLVTTCTSENMDREHVAIGAFKQQCECGMVGEFAGLMAFHHWVECWEQ
jgi:transcription elongation factor Elf1